MSAAVDNRPRVLDLCCCEGGAAKGYADAGCRVYGSDLNPRFRKRYPFAFLTAIGGVPVDKAHPADVLVILWHLIAGGTLTFTHKDGTTEELGLGDFAFIHVSPPCQKYSITNAARGHDYPDLVGPVREALIATGLPWVIENVVGAPLRGPVELCGCMFGLKAKDTDGLVLHMWRPRQFESNVPLEQPRPGSLRLPRSTVEAHGEEFHAHEWVGGAYGGARRDKYEAKYVRKGGYVPAKHVQEQMLGIDWMTQHGLFQSVPPVYTKYVGQGILAALAFGWQPPLVDVEAALAGVPA